jgi:DNA (cytosine-5)-methyltransferase 1
MRPRLLDLFCRAGGCSVGYHRAGFDVVGVDIEPQPRYPFPLVQADALEFLREHVAWDLLHGFDAIHASPPCQMYSRALKHMSAPQPMLIEPIRELLVISGAPWIIENVEGAPIPTQSTLLGQHGAMLCGTSFGMRIFRHRLFEASFPISGLPCSHTRLAMNPHNQAGRDLMYDEFGRSDPEVIWRREMGVEWMGRYDAREAIPPAFTEFLGRQLLDHIDPTQAQPRASETPHAALPQDAQ